MQLYCIISSGCNCISLIVLSDFKLHAGFYTFIAPVAELLFNAFHFAYIQVHEL